MYHDLLTLEDRADIGDGWYYGMAANDQHIYSSACQASVALVHDGPYLTTFRIRTSMPVPAEFDFSSMKRSEELVELVVDHLVSLRPGADYLEIETRVQNNAKDHRLRALFRSGALASTFFSDTPFDVVEPSVNVATSVKDVPPDNYRRVKLRKWIVAIIPMLLITCFCGQLFGQQGIITEKEAGLQADIIAKTFFMKRTADLPEMLRIHQIRVLVVPSRSTYFIDDTGQPRGLDYELLKSWEKMLNAKRPKGEPPVSLIFIPVIPNELADAIREGPGDIAGLSLITPSRTKEFAYTTPLFDMVEEVVVTKKGDYSLARLEDLSGKEVYVVRGSAQLESIEELNKHLQKQRLSKMARARRTVAHPRVRLGVSTAAEHDARSAALPWLGARGFLPAGSFEDVTDFHYWLSTNAITWRGVETAAAALEAIGHPEAERIRRESVAYKADLVQGFETMRQHTPVVRLRDGRWVPHYPSRLYWRRRDVGWIREVLEGSVYLLLSGLYDANGPQAQWILDDYQDNRYVKPPYGYPITNFAANWYDRGGFSIQPNLLAGLLPHLDRDEPEIFLWMFFNENWIA